MDYEKYYLEKANAIGKMLWDMPISTGDKKNYLYLDELVHKSNRENFIEVVKSYIERNYGHQQAFEILFTDDYKGIKKMALTSQPPLAVPP